MAIRIQCTNPQCGKSLDCPDEHAGKPVKCPACGTTLNVPAPANAGPSPQVQGTQTLGEYRLIRKLGEGGMGTVYEAEHCKLERRVALKVLPQKFTQDPIFLERFHREAKSAAALNHPNIIQLYDIGEDKGFHFFGMEFVDGQSAQERLQGETKLPSKDALEIVEGVGRALQNAHQHGIIHRDIKPDNIMLSKEGRVKLADLGLAKKLDDADQSVTQTGAGLGTPYYMAPEQAEDAAHVDHRADIYALGITLLHLLTGKRPYGGNSAYSIIIAHTTKPLPTGEQLGTPLPDPVEALIRKMCAKDPNERYQDYGALLSDIERAKAGQPTAAMSGGEAAIHTPTQAATEPASSPRRSRLHREKKRKSKTEVFIGAAAVVALVAAGLYFGLRGKGVDKTVAQASSLRKDVAQASTTGGPSLREESRAGIPAPRQSGDLGAMLAYAEQYAGQHPNEYEEIIRKYDLVKQKSEASVEGMKAADATKSWRKKWSSAASEEFDKRKASSAAALEQWKFEEAEAAWRAFPKSLRAPSMEPKIEGELARLEKARNGIVKALEDESKPLLAKKPEALTAEDTRALSALLGKAKNPPKGLSEEASQTLKAVAEKLQEILDSHEAAAAAKAQEVSDGFWAKYETFIKRKKFDEAVKLSESSEGGTTNLNQFLRADAFLLKSFFTSVEVNLSTLKGKTLRVGGIAMQVKEVKDGQLMLSGRGATMAWGADRLDVDTVLKLGLESVADPKAKARAEALYRFHFGKTKDAAEALKKAEESGENVSFYRSRMVPMLVVRTTPAGAKVRVWAAPSRGKGEPSGAVSEPLAKGNSPLRVEVEKNTAYRVVMSKEGYQSVTAEVKVGEAGEFGVSARLKKARMPAAMLAHFEIQRESKDTFGNPVRKGFDRKTGMPLEIRHKQTGMHFVLIPAGEFLMGSPENEKDRDASREGPVHKVRLTQLFYLGKYEVTQAEWKKVMGRNPSGFPGDRNPVVMVSWEDCQEFLKKLNSLPAPGARQAGQSRVPGSQLQLPTEAQWEYACRAGTQTRFYYGDDPDYKKLPEYAWFNKNSGLKTHPVGEKKPNAWGLYDMSGNVWEWCSDWYGGYPSKGVTDPVGPTLGSDRVYRGGSWRDTARYYRSAYRRRNTPGNRDYNLGFRLALPVQQR